MRFIVTAGPTREPIDSVRFITNASSGQMGAAVAVAAASAGHAVTLLAGPVSAQVLAPAREAGCEIVPFVTVDELQRELAARFGACDCLVMAAAVGDFRAEPVVQGKIPRAGGTITIRLSPTQDVVAGVAAHKRPGQIVITFAVEDLPPEQMIAKAQAELVAKHGDFVVVNPPSAMAAGSSLACIVGLKGMVLPWASRPKAQLAQEIVRLVEKVRSM